MKDSKLLAGLISMGLLFSATAFAGGVDITVSDYLPGPVRTIPSFEDNETEPNTVQAQAWDLERLVYGAASYGGATTTTLSIIGGYDFLNGVSGSTFYSGDIWIDVNGGSTVPAGTGGSNNYQIVSGNGGYDFVVHFYDRANPAGGNFDLNSLAYQIYDIRSGSVSYYDVYYQQNNAANPYVLASGGTVIGSAAVAGYALLGNAAATNAANSGTWGWDPVTPWVGYGPDNHYYLNVDLAPILGLGVVLDEAKFTMGCGNDMIVGDFTRAVPEGGSSLILLGFGMLALGAVARKMAA